MFSAEDDPARPPTGAGSTDAGDDGGGGNGGRAGRYPVPGADGWSFLPLERNDETREHHITLEREDGERVEMTLPSFVEQGDELQEIAVLVIRARERWRDLKGLGA